MRLSTRLMIAMVALVLLTATTVSLLTYHNVLAIALPRGLERINTQVRVIASDLEAPAQEARADVIGFRASVAVNEIMMARLRASTDPSASSNEADERGRLAFRFVNELMGKPEYAQFRVIGVDDGGREIVRVDRSGPNGAIRIVPDTELQRKGDRSYFKKAIALPADDIYVSQVDLNQEHGAFETPYVPTLRTAAPIYTPDGKPFGVVIINVDLRPAFARVRRSIQSGSKLYVVNEKGDYLFHPDPSREFGFEFGKPTRIQDDFPQFANLLAANDAAPRVMTDSAGTRFGVGWRSIRLADGPRVSVIEAMPYPEVIASATAIRTSTVVGGLAAVLCAFALAAALARSLTRPLVRITKAVEGFPSDAAVDMPAGGGRELNVLVDAFKRMSTDSRAKTAALQQEIEERQRVFDTSPDLILVTDREGTFMRVSPSSEAILGYRSEEMAGHSAAKFIYAEDLEPTRDEMRLARRGQVIRNFETRYVHKDGRIVILAWTGVWSEAAQRHFFIGRDTTEQKRAEEQFREQKALLDSAVNNMQHGLLMFEPNNKAVVINQTYIEMYRLSPDRVTPGITMRELLELRAKNGTFEGNIDDYINTQTLAGAGAVTDRVFQLPDGRSIRVVNRAIGDGGWVSTHEDITARRKAEAEIRGYAEREQLFIAAVESSNDAIVTKSLDAVITGWNHAAEALFGFTAEEAIGQSIDIIVPDELRGEVRGFLAQVKDGGKVEHHETTRVNKSGQRIQVSLSISPIKSPSGAIIGAAKVARDISARIKAQEALRESERLAQDIIASALDGFVQLNDVGEVIEWNPQAEAIFGWSREEALGTPLSELYLPAEHQLHSVAMIERVREEGESAHLGQRFKLDALHKDGRVIKIEVALTALRRRDGYVFNGFVRDLTKQIAAEEQLRQAQKMESVGHLTGGVAHDFNNVLTVITGTIDMLAEAVAEKPQLAAIAKLISEAADRGAELTGHLLAFARKQPLQPRETNINDLIVEAVKLLRATLGEQIEVEAFLKHDAWLALVDPNQLSSALLNLAINARDAMPNGGKLVLETSNAVLDQSYADSHAEVQPGDYVLFAVSDTGSGIPEGIRAKVFEPFFTTKGVGRGTGLGLSMVYGFVKQSGGHIKIYSEEGHGTTFKIYLPRADVVGSSVAAAPLEAGLRGGTETILIVEDDPLVRTSVTAQISSLGYRTLSAGNAAEALSLVDGGARFDLLFTDVMMPGQMNGRQLAEEAAKRRSPLKVVFTSGYTENAIIHHGRLDPGVLLLAKPYRKIDLARTLRTALDEADKPAGRVEEPSRSHAG